MSEESTFYYVCDKCGTAYGERGYCVLCNCDLRGVEMTPGQMAAAMYNLIVKINRLVAQREKIEAFLEPGIVGEVHLVEEGTGQ